MNLEECPYIELNIGEKNALYSLAGHLISKISKQSVICEECVSTLLASKSDSVLNRNAQLSILKADDMNKYHFVTENVFSFFCEMEVICRHVTGHFCNDKTNISEKCVKAIMKLEHPFDETCSQHQCISKIIIKRFVQLRLKISKSEKDSLQTFNYDSYSLR